MSDQQPKKSNNNSFSFNMRTVTLFMVCIAVFLFVAQFDAIKSVVGWITEMLMPVLIGIMLAYIINPLVLFFERGLSRLFAKRKKMTERSRRRTSRGLSIIISLFVLIAFIALLMFLILPEFFENLKKLVDISPDLIGKASNWITGVLDSDNAFMVNIREYVDSLVESLTNWLTSDVSSLVESIISVVSEGVISVVSFVFDCLIAIVVLIYALIEKNKFVAQCKKLLFALFKRERANDILDIARYGNDVFGKFISGKLLTSTIVGVVTFIFMTIAGMPYALLSACIIAITNIIPFFGPFIGAVPTAFIVIITDLQQGLIYIGFLVILQQIEGNIIEPMIMEDKTGVSKFWIIFALLLCGGIFGLAGMIFSVPLFAVLFYTIKKYVDRALEKKNLPLPSDAYRNVGSVDPETNELLPPPEKGPGKKISDAIREWRERKKSASTPEASEESSAEDSE